MSSKKSCRDTLLEHTTEPEVFQDMQNFEYLNDYNKFALSIRLQFPKFSKGFSSSDFESFIKEHVGEENVKSLGRLSFPNEWQMEVTKKEIRETLIRMGRTKINTRSCWISPLSQSELRGYIHWIPNAIGNKDLETILHSHGEVLFMENQRQVKWSSKIESDSRYFAIYLKSGQTMDDVPHFIKVDNFLGLVTIRGRTPACFHCKQLGHRKIDCKKYREKLSDYCLRKGTASKRRRPRGRRHTPKKTADESTSVVTKLSELKIKPGYVTKTVQKIILKTEQSNIDKQAVTSDGENAYKESIQVETSFEEMKFDMKVPKLSYPLSEVQQKDKSSAIDPAAQIKDLRFSTVEGVNESAVLEVSKPEGPVKTRKRKKKKKGVRVIADSKN